MFLQYLLGFRRLGYDVLFVDRLDDPGDDDGVARLAEIMAWAGLGDSWALIERSSGSVHGRSLTDVEAALDRSVMLLNVMGYLDDAALRGRAELRVFLDIDPGFGQVWHALGQADLFAGHDRHVTVGTCLGQPGCPLPTAGIDWIPTVPPVVLDEWPVVPLGHTFTTIGSWRGPFAPLAYGGTTYGLRVHAFRDLFELPARTAARFVAALDIDPSDRPDIAALQSHGWDLVDPLDVASTPRDYRAFVQQSGPELMIAKHAYSAGATGWISDRSVCFLASGRPVLASDTGVADIVPGDEGYLTFGDLDEAIRGVETILRDPARHAAAARRIAEAVFDSDIALSRLLDTLDVDGPRLAASG